MQVVCPQCKGELSTGYQRYGCGVCRREYPVICGIPDFRLDPDPYISIADDHRKGEVLFRAGQDLSFAQLLRHYYALTPEVPSDHAERWIAHSLAQVEIARETLRQCGLQARADGALLDIGCSTGGLLSAAASSYGHLTGVDVAFRWLVVGHFRLRQLGIQADLICANAESLPFPDKCFELVTAIDVIEHVRDPQLVVCEAARVSCDNARTICATNNRYAPLPDPQIGVWAVGYVPRRWQPAYVALRRRGLHIYRVRMRSAAELDRMFSRAGYRHFHTKAAPLIGPHLSSRALQSLLAAYNRLRKKAFTRGPLRLVAPRLMTTAVR